MPIPLSGQANALAQIAIQESAFLDAAHALGDLVAATVDPGALTAIECAAISAMRARGFAVTYFNAAELAGVPAKLVEESMTSSGLDTIREARRIGMVRVAPGATLDDLAEEAWVRYEFEQDGLSIEDVDGWQRRTLVGPSEAGVPGDEMTRVLYVRFDHDPPEATTHRWLFVVKRIEEGVLATCFDERGAEVGYLPDRPAPEGENPGLSSNGLEALGRQAARQLGGSIDQLSALRDQILQSVDGERKAVAPAGFESLL